MTISSMEEMFNYFGYKINDMKENTPYPVKNKKTEVLSINPITGLQEYKRIINIFYKGKQNIYIVLCIDQNNNSYTLRASAKHLLAFTTLLPYYTFLEIENINEILKHNHNSYLIGENCNPLKIITIIDTKTLEDVIDIEVEDTHQYLTNGILSHNSAYQAVETTSGGKAIPYYTSQRIRFSNKGPSENITGAVTIKAALKKNKLFPLIQSEVEMDFIPGKGVDKTSDYLSVSKELGITTLSGPYYSVWDGTELLGKFQGRVKFGEWVMSSKENTERFENLVRKKFDEVYHSMTTQPSEEEENEIEVF